MVKKVEAMTVLVTGAAGFIGFHLCKKLSNYGIRTIGVDNINNYYDQKLKLDRLAKLGVFIDLEAGENKTTSILFPNFEFYRIDISNKKKLEEVFKKNSINKVCNLAAQAGVRYSINHPDNYIESNIMGFFNILECCRHNKIKDLVYASSSSVYGLNNKIPFSTEDMVDKPISLYAATKKSNELMAHAYSNLYDIHTVGLRFFTVYGPWGRPDMAYFLFTKAILGNHKIKVFNNGDLNRDFTYIDDVIEGLFRILTTIRPTIQRYKVYNIGNNRPINLLNFIELIEKNLGKRAVKEMVPMQPGDVFTTYADCSNLKNDYKYSPSTNIETGISKFINWYLKYYE